MSTDDLMIQLLADLTDTSVTDLEIGELLTTLADQCRDVLGVVAAGVLLMGPDGRLELKACSNGAERHAGLFDAQIEQGPCLDSCLTDQVVAVDDLAIDQVTTRWPSFAPAARAAGFGRAGAIPMRSGHHVIGVLGVLGDDSTPMDAEALIAAQGLADTAAASVIRTGAGSGGTIEERLGRALGDRVIIEQAKGIIAERDDVDIDEAFAWMRDHGRARRLRLVDVAGAVIDGTLISAALDDAPTLRVTLPCSSSASRIARRAFDGWADPLGMAQRVRDDARLVVSELVTNAVTHARSTPTLKATRIDGVVRVEVGDGDPTLVVAGSATDSLMDGSGGHGLWIVQRLSESWGCVAFNGGKVVWSEIR